MRTKALYFVKYQISNNEFKLFENLTIDEIVLNVAENIKSLYNYDFINVNSNLVKNIIYKPNKINKSIRDKIVIKKMF